MAIEFFCTGCQQRLSVPDESAGKQAKCPSCSAILAIPSAAPKEMDAGRQGNPYVGDDTLPVGHSAPGQQNPYAAPTGVPDVTQVMRGELSLQAIDAGYALSSAWRLFKISGVLLVAAYVIQLAFNFGITVVGTIAETVAGEILGDPQSLLVLIINLGTTLLNNLVQFWLAIGWIRINLAVARGEPAEILMLFSGGHYLLRYIGGGIIFGLAVGVGLILLIVPGIYIAATYWSYMYFLVDRDCGVFESFQLAGMHASGNRMQAVLLGIMAIGLSFLGLLACGVGMLVTVPLVMLMIVIAYLMMTGQPFAQPT